MEDFCGSEFWDRNTTWDTESPDFTPCFEKTVLPWAGCAFLWITGIFEFIILCRSKSGARCNLATFLNITKVLINCVLIIIEVLSLAFAFRTSRNLSYTVYSVDKVTPTVKLATFTFALVLQVLNRRKGVASSGVLFIFWFLEAVFEAFRFQTAIRQLPEDQNEHERRRFILLMVSFPMVLAECLLHFFADPESDEQMKGSTGAEPVEQKSSSVATKPCPEKKVSFASRITFQWFWPLAVLGYKRPIELEDLWDLNPEDKSQAVIGRFNRIWRRAQRKNKGKELGTSYSETLGSAKSSLVIEDPRATKKKKLVSILPVLWKCNRSALIVGGLAKVISDLMLYVSPRILDLLIAHVEADEERWKGYFFAALLYLNVSIQILFQGQYFKNNFVTGMRIRTALIGAVYQKALVVSNAARKHSTVGEIVNLMAVDAQKLSDCTMSIQIVWSSPIQIAWAMYYLWITLGISVLAGVAVLLTLIPTNILILRRVKSYQILQMKLKDRRVKLMSEILAGMKVLKLYAWEPAFEEQVIGIRKQEMKLLRKEAFLTSISSFIWFITPFVVSLASFATYVLIDEANILDARKAFVSLTYFNLLKLPMTILPNALVSIMQAVVSTKRLNKFMNSEEIDTSAVTHHKSSDGSVVSVENGNFAWNDSLTLRNINLSVPKGSLVAIIGPVGAGKSSLLQALLGEMDKLSGNVNTTGSIAYVAQQAWIQNATLKDNILFGEEYDAQKYDQIVEACALKPDLKILPGGDRTEIGEMGINLSGGQKQRVSLARAVYHDSDVYLLDDSLSAVDAHVGRQLFEQVIGPSGLLFTKTRLVVTHSVTYLSQMDRIVVMNEGQIVESGTFNELIEKKGAFADFVAQHSNPEEEGMGSSAAEDPLDEHLSGELSSLSGSYKANKADLSLSIKSGGSSVSVKGDRANEKLITIEKTETGNVKSNVYQYYVKSFSSKRAVLTLVLYILLHGLSLLSSVWLGEWSNVEPVNGTQDTTKRDLYLGVYGGFGLAQAMASLIGNMILAYGCLRASGLLHNNMLKRIMRAPMSFFDTTPLGRIVNRFSRDVDVMDNSFPGNLRSFISYLFQVISTVVVISYSVPLFLAVVVPLGIVYYAVQRFYIASSRQLKRLESLTRSPIYSHFSETLTGTTTIRAFGAQQRFIEKSEQAVDLNQRTYYPSVIANRWVGYNLETLGNLIVLFSALLAVISNRGESSLGLSVSYALSITQALKWLVRVSADVEMNVVSVERLKEYGEVEQEAVWDIPERRPPSDWPDKGEIRFMRYQTRYRAGLDLVLRGITCRIQSGEKVGIVGRTGAGKSSLTLGLFRIIEAAGGSIEIDGQTLADLGLHDVRGRLTIIPQDPVLFAGSLRMNLDPALKHSDDEIWRALRHAHLDNFARSLATGLDHEISEGGGNLSVGQRQLVCLARALLRKTRILILDEATAAVDLETDDLIQRTIRTEFNDSTVLTIAHRLNTILDYDRVMVLDNGEIREFSSPQDLLKNTNSIFYSMARDAGLIS